ncbi:hypothetical protein Lal_00018812 [Lupinus albus]|nr:hypothetical protein Lal_00018812 [Lupinus albus]
MKIIVITIPLNRLTCQTRLLNRQSLAWPDLFPPLVVFEEAKDLEQLKIDELQRSLEAHE